MLRVTTEITGPQGAPYYTTIHFGGTTSGQATAAANAVRTFWADLADRLWEGMSPLVQSDIPSIDPATGQIVEMFSVVTTAVDMNAVGEPLPPFTQLLHRWRTGDFVAGRELRGRTFVPGIMEVDSVNGAPTAGLLADVQAAFDAMGTNGVPAGQIVVYSPTHHVFSLVSSHTNWNQFAILRSRRD